MSASDVNRVFLQALLSRQCMPLPLAHILCKNAIQAVNSVNGNLNLVYSPAFYSDLVGEINRALEPLFLEFRQMMSEDDGQPVCAIINVSGDGVAQMATQYTPAEIAYFKLIIEHIMLAPNESYCVPSMVALREAANLPTKFTKAQAEALLTSFVANGWLMLSPEGRYTLSSRAVMELQTYLRSTYEDEVLECTSCMEMVTKGISCYTPNCKCRLHNHCYKLHMNTRQTCPSCQADWSAGAPRVNKVGEAAAERDDGRAHQPRRQRRSGGERDAPESEDELGSRHRSQSRGSDGGRDDDEEELSRGKGKATARKRSGARASSSAHVTRSGRGGRQPAHSEVEAEMQDDGDDPVQVNPRRRSKHR